MVYLQVPFIIAFESDRRARLGLIGTLWWNVLKCSTKTRNCMSPGLVFTSGTCSSCGMLKRKEKMWLHDGTRLWHPAYRYHKLATLATEQLQGRYKMQEGRHTPSWLGIFEWKVAPLLDGSKNTPHWRGLCSKLKKSLWPNFWSKKWLQGVKKFVLAGIIHFPGPIVHYQAQNPLTGSQQLCSYSL